VSAGHDEEGDCRLVLLIGQDSGEADARVIVNGDVQILVTGAAGLPSTVSVDAMARLDDASQPFDIEADQIARMQVFIANHGWWRIKRTQPIDPGPTQDAADRGPAQAQFVGDRPAIPAQSAKCQDPFQ
jgi:hypothetical protein